MKRTQLYLDEEMARILETLSRQKDTTVSELVRASLCERYMPGQNLDRVSPARSLAGIWKNRDDLLERGHRLLWPPVSIAEIFAGARKN